MKKLGLTYKHILLYASTLLIVVGGDQLTKVIVDHILQKGAAYTIIDNFFYFTYYQNKGAAWGLFEGKLNLFFIVAVIATIGIIYYFHESQAYQKLTRFGLVLVMGGLLGNLIDRVVFGYVRDFIGFYIFGYSFPIFNVADMAITIGMCLVILDVGIEEYKAWKMSKSQS